MTDQVMSDRTRNRQPLLARASFGQSLQRKCSCGGSGGGSGDCDECKESKQVQRKASAPGGSDYAPSLVHEVVNSSGRPLDAATRNFFEPRLQFDFSRVRIHANHRAAASARAVNALAYTVGRDVVFGAGQYAPDTPEGKRLIGHELTHVVQQSRADARQGAVLQRQVGGTQGSTSNPCPSSTGIATYRQFNHGDLPASEQANFRTYLGMLVRHDLSPGPDHTGHCIQEELSLLSTDCPASMTTALNSCSKSDCLPINRRGQDRSTGISLPSSRKAFLDIHRTESARSVLEGTGKNACRIVCQQKYHCDSLSTPVLGVFRVTRNFRADTFTPAGGSPRHITTGTVEKVESFGKGDFPTRTLPKDVDYA